ncbi:MAG: ClpXP protease specificity-enhancing factor [Burkholderiales bacterium]|jgi:stringent starvation protein B|nr:ClpXP protease specificity-enhancing factor [Burkholderiales bacterium]
MAEQAPTVSTKPYLVRAIYEWCTDAGFTPYVAVAVDESVRVPMEFVKNGEIVLNVSSLATNRLQIANDAISFQARFGGVAREVYVPIGRVVAVYARENGQGMAFDVPRLAHAGAESAAEPAGLRPVEAPRERAALVPVTPVAAPPSNDATPPEPPDPARPAPDRPKLTRIK